MVLNSNNTISINSKAGIAVKGLVVIDDKILIIKRHNADVQKPGMWEFPGGRLDKGENPFLGLKREILEEVGLDVEIFYPLEVRYFVRDDGQPITMIIFLCKAKSKNIILSQEHSDYKLCNINYVKDDLGDFFHNSVDVYSKYFKNKF
ncbi:MAG: NUDIX domain-containing protein [Candidatus Woesearchaeota archaeon]